MSNWLDAIIDWLFLDPLPKGEHTVAEARDYLAQYMPQRLSKMSIAREVRDGEPVFVATDIETGCSLTFGARKCDF